jgi:hypothetical protein
MLEMSYPRKSPMAYQRSNSKLSNTLSKKGGSEQNAPKSLQKWLKYTGAALHDLPNARMYEDKLSSMNLLVRICSRH